MFTIYWFNFFIIIYWSYIFIGYLHKNLNLLIYRVKFSHILSHYKIEVQNRTLNTLSNYTILTFKMVTSKKKKKILGGRCMRLMQDFLFRLIKKNKIMLDFLDWLTLSTNTCCPTGFQYPCLTNLPLEYFSWVVLLSQPCHQ